MPIHPTYTRLLEAAANPPLKAHGPTEISNKLSLLGIKVTEQMLSNWKTRGVSRKAMFVLAEPLGVSVAWFATGRDPTMDSLATAALRANLRRQFSEDPGSLGDEQDYWISDLNLESAAPDDIEEFETEDDIEKLIDRLAIALAHKTPTELDYAIARLKVKAERARARMREPDKKQANGG